MPKQTCKELRLAAIGVDEIPFRDPEIEELLQGQKITDSLLDELAAQVSEKVDPFSDLHATAEQRKHLAGVLAKKTIKKAEEAALLNLKKES